MHNIEALIKLSENVARPHTGGGVRTGYIPHHKFDFLNYLVSGRHDYGDNEYHYVGEELMVKIAFASWDDMRKNIKIGDKFEIRELHRLVGFGVVKSIV